MASKRRRHADDDDDYCTHCGRTINVEKPCPGCGAVLCSDKCFKGHTTECGPMESRRTIAKVLRFAGFCSVLYFTGWLLGWVSASGLIVSAVVCGGLLCFHLAEKLTPRR